MIDVSWVANVVCEQCGNELSDSDHYCAACGKPNTEGKLFPRFEAGVYDVPVLIDVAEPGEGEFACPRCRRPTLTGVAWCQHCGMDLERAAMLAQRGPTVGLWRRTGPVSIDPYRPLQGMAVAVRTVALVSGLAALFAVVVVMWRFLAISTDGAGIDDAIADWAQVASIITLVSALVAVAFTVIWCNRAVRNLPALAVSDGRHKPALAVLGWFVPVVNLWVPQSVVEELWWRSSPSGYPIDPRPERSRPPLALGLFWPCIVCGVALVVLALLAEPSSSENLDTWRLALVMSAVGWGLLAAGLFGLALVVAEVTDRQDLRSERLGPPAVLAKRNGDGDGDDEVEIDLEADGQGVGVRVRRDESVTWGRY